MVDWASIMRSADPNYLNWGANRVGGAPHPSIIAIDAGIGDTSTISGRGSTFLYSSPSRHSDLYAISLNS